ncbi:MAG TPA: hypothetical protein VED46_15885 [Alphaproteobacteria bacterium]|nr:hypothetical protein [Alphaproteobacteria bacterium]
MQARTLAAAFNGIIVLLLYLSAWGASSWTVAAIEIALAAGASLSTWYALKRATTPAWLTRLAPRRPKVRV